MNQQESSLNERILEIIEDNIDRTYILNGKLHYDGILIGTPDAALRIERLVLQEKIDLLNSLWQRHMTNNKLLGENFSTYITELQNQLKQL